MESVKKSWLVSELLVTIWLKKFNELNGVYMSQSLNEKVVGVKTLNELINALSNASTKLVKLTSTIVSPHDLFVPEGISLQGGESSPATLSFSQGGGLGLFGNNTISNLSVITTPSARAIFLVAGQKQYGKIELTNLIVTGQVGLILRVGSDQAAIIAENIHVVASDSRAYTEQPQKYGVNVLQGAFTVYNFNGDAASKITASLTNISVGMRGAPVLGSGIFIGGFGDVGGSVEVERLTTGPVYSHGLLTSGTADFITAGVFLLYGAHAQKIENLEEVVTYGINDMVLDNWGSVTEWICKKPILSYGASGIGFVNFGTVDNFIAEDSIVTYGEGARGFNQYDGTVKNIKFKSITTHGNGSIGIQISKPIGSLTIDEDLETFGGLGSSLVKGVNLKLHALALSIKPGGVVEVITVGGAIISHGENVDAYSVDGGMVKAISVARGIRARGKDAHAMRLENGGKSPTANLTLIPPSP